MEKFVVSWPEFVKKIRSILGNEVWKTQDSQKRRDKKKKKISTILNEFTRCIYLNNDKLWNLIKKGVRAENVKY